MAEDGIIDQQESYDRETCRQILTQFVAFMSNLFTYRSRQYAQEFSSTLATIFTNMSEVNIKEEKGLLLVNNHAFTDEIRLMTETLSRMEKMGITSIQLLPGINDDELIYIGTNIFSENAQKITDPGKVNTSKHIKIKFEESEIRGSASPITSMGQHFEKIKHQRNLWFSLLKEEFALLLEQQKFDLDKLSEPIEALIDSVADAPSFHAAEFAAQSISNLNIQHAYHTMVLAIYLGYRLEFDLSGIKTLAVAAILHDIGRHFFPSDFSTCARLNPEVIPLIQSHVIEGSLFLAGVDSLPAAVILTALNHHHGYDKKGYPEMPASIDQHIFSLIVELADFMSWRTVSDRYYHKPVTLHRLVRTMANRSGTQFDPLLVKLLLPFFGIYPPGTVVKLDSGDTGVVLFPDPHHIARPVIGIPESEEKLNIVHLAELDVSNIKVFKRTIQSVVGSEPGIDYLIELSGR